MRKIRRRWLGLLALLAAVILASVPVSAQQQKPNILFIMGDDIGWMQVGTYQRGLGLAETPNIDRIASEGATFMHYYAEQSCTAGRNAFFTGMNPLRTGMIPPQLPGSPSYLRPGTPALAKFLLDLGYNTGEFGKNHLGDHTDALTIPIVIAKYDLESRADGQRPSTAVTQEHAFRSSERAQLPRDRRGIEFHSLTFLNKITTNTWRLHLFGFTHENYNL